ncbi:MAG: aminotransferase class IV [bacterium]
MNKIFINGNFVPANKAKITVFDRGFLYGDGVFESFRTYNKKPFLLDEHLKRLLAGAKALGIRSPYNINKLKSFILTAIRLNNFKETYLKVIITRGDALGHGLSFSNTTGKPNVIIIAEELKEPRKELFTNGLKAIISSFKRTDSPTNQLKTLCYIDNALALAEAKKAGAKEAFFLDEKGHLLEGTVSNLFIVKLGSLYTPPATAPILRGITRDFVMALAKQSAIRVLERSFTPRELYNADECFVTMSGTGIIPITRIGNRKIGKGKCCPVTEKLIKLYQEKAKR